MLDEHDIGNKDDWSRYDYDMLLENSEIWRKEIWQTNDGDIILFTTQ